MPGNAWDDPRKSTKASISKEAEKGIYFSKSLQICWDNREDNIKVKADMEVRKVIDLAKIGY